MNISKELNGWKSWDNEEEEYIKQTNLMYLEEMENIGIKVKR